MNSKRILIWYRNDLRVHDHAPLCRALQADALVVPVYCFDSRQFGKTTLFGFPKTGAFRAQFLIESVADLRASLQTLGSNLIVRRGYPEKQVTAIAQDLHIDAVYFHTEVTAEELAVESALEIALSRLDIGVKRFWGSTLYNLDHLPFRVDQIPELFTHFRKQVERDAVIAPVEPTPIHLTKIACL